MNRDRAYAHFPGGTDHSKGNFASVRHKDFVEHLPAYSMIMSGAPYSTAAPSSTMMRFTRFETLYAARYLDKLREHFSRRVAVHAALNRCWVQFPFGRCDMCAYAHHLNLRARATDAEALAQVVHVMTSHLERYAFRENPVLDWQPAPLPDARHHTAPAAQDPLP